MHTFMQGCPCAHTHVCAHVRAHVRTHARTHARTHSRYKEFDVYFRMPVGTQRLRLSLTSGAAPWVKYDEISLTLEYMKYVYVETHLRTTHEGHACGKGTLDTPFDGIKCVHCRMRACVCL